MTELFSGSFRERALGIFGFLACVNFGAWLWAFLAFLDKPVLLGTAFLAYTFGLRHAVDADHIAAIDNVTRKAHAGRSTSAFCGLFLFPRPFNDRCGRVP